ncbi:hypothetical protein ACFFSW_07345 [Saccharothrix longispora]|uniref:Membrane protein n=1 Tax=Saccharothrix longispora TaxID=33920 RepID=A0ABU1PUW6_9PSEU|nr:hypothetical protein [Saccharothrix longispora]MDR6593684.1 putative membrane protein [Saccharothrix longispora]
MARALNEFDDAGGPEIVVAAAASATGLWGYFAFFVGDHVSSGGLGVAVLMGSYLVNALVQTSLLLLLRACHPLRVRLVIGQLDGTASGDRFARSRPYGQWLRPAAFFGPVIVNCSAMLAFTPSGASSGSDDFGITTTIVLFTLLGVAATLLGAVGYFFVVLPFAGLAGAFLPESLGRIEASRAEAAARSWILPFTGLFGVSMGAGDEVRSSDLGQWFVDDLGSPVPLPPVLLVVAVVGITTSIVINNRARRKRARALRRV